MEWNNPANAGNREAGAITQPSIRPIDSLLFWLIANNAVSLSQLTQADFPTKIQCDDGGFFLLLDCVLVVFMKNVTLGKKKKKRFCFKPSVVVKLWKVFIVRILSVIQYAL